MPHFPQILESFVKVFKMFIITFVSPLITNYLWLRLQTEAMYTTTIRVNCIPWS